MTGRAPDGSPWPRISIVTPSYNQAEYLEETIRSVLLQGYPDLEYIVMDGGSTDGSVDILHRYEAYFAYWTSARDAGQAAAIRSGFERATGRIVGYLNSDDLLLPGALQAVAAYFVRHPKTELVVGKSLVVDEQSRVTFHSMGHAPTFHSLLFDGTRGFTQPASFWKREAMLATGIVDATLRFAIDYDLYLRLTRRTRARRLDAYLAAFRVHPTSKTSMLQDVRRDEDERLQRKYGIERYPRPMVKLANWYYRGRYRFYAGLFRARLGLGLERVPDLS